MLLPILCQWSKTRTNLADLEVHLMATFSSYHYLPVLSNPLYANIINASLGVKTWKFFAKNLARCFDNALRDYRMPKNKSEGKYRYSKVY